MDAFDMEWHVPERVIMARYHGVVTLDTLDEINNSLAQMHTEGTGPIHIISDASDLKTFPTSINHLRKTLTILNEDGWGWIISIGMDSLNNFLLSVMAALFGMKIKTAKSIEEAEQILRRVDMTLEEFQQKKDTAE